MKDDVITRTEYERRHAELLEALKVIGTQTQAFLEQSQANTSAIAELRGWVKGAVTGVSVLAAVAMALPFLVKGG